MEGAAMAMVSEPTRVQARNLPALLAAVLVVAVVLAGPALNRWSVSRHVRTPDSLPVVRPIADFWGVSLFATENLAVAVSPAQAERSVRTAGQGRLDHAQVTRVSLMLATDREQGSGLGLKDLPVYYVVTHQGIPASRRPGGGMPNTNGVGRATCATFALVDATTAKVLGELHASCRF
jgi:hypothetical protein